MLPGGKLRRYALCELSCNALFNDMQFHNPLYRRIQETVQVDEHIVPGIRQIDHDASALREAEMRCTHALMLKYGIMLQSATEAGETAMPVAFVTLCKDMLQLRVAGGGDDSSKETVKQAAEELDAEVDNQIATLETKTEAGWQGSQKLKGACNVACTNPISRS